MPAAKPKMAAASFVVFVATPDGEIEQLNAATARVVTMPREKEEKGGRGEAAVACDLCAAMAALTSSARCLCLCPCLPPSLPFASLPALLPFVPNENIRA